MGIESKLTGVPDFDRLEIVKTGTHVGASDTGLLSTITIPHNLGFTAIPMGFLESGTIFIPLPTWLSANGDGGTINFLTYAYIYADDTNVYIGFLNATGSATPTLTFRYYLLRQIAST